VTSVLGVSASATPTEITHAYRQKLRAQHPDTRSMQAGAAPVADEQLQRLLAAYAILHDRGCPRRPPGVAASRRPPTLAATVCRWRGIRADRAPDPDKRSVVAICRATTRMQLPGVRGAARSCEVVL